MQSAAGTGAKGLKACGAIAAGSLAHGLGYGFGRVLGGDAGGAASRMRGLRGAPLAFGLFCFFVAFDWGRAEAPKATKGAE